MTPPSPPFVLVEGIHNFRDIGGYPTTLGRTTSAPGRSRIRRGQLYRSAEPSQITPAGMAVVRALGITTVFDLRSGPEIESAKDRSPVVEIPHTQRVFVPVFKDQDYSPEHIALRYRDYASSDGHEVRCTHCREWLLASLANQ